MKKLPSEQIDTLNTTIPCWIYNPKEGQSSHTSIIAESSTKSSLEQLADYLLALEQKNKDEYLAGIDRIKRRLETDMPFRQHLSIFLENTIQNPNDIRDILTRNSIAL